MYIVKITKYHYILRDMKSKVVLFLFIFAIAILGGSYYLTKKLSHNEETVISRAKVVTPKSSEEETENDESYQNSLQAEQYKTFVDLLPTETLISSLTIDLNDDGYDDEVIAVRRTDSPYFIIIPALYNTELSAYQRLSEIPTKMSRTRTLSYSGMDITGEHKTALVYQGVEDDGNYVMQIFHTVLERGNYLLVKIGDFTSDGTIFIQQTERSDSYELSLSKGESYSVWVYRSEKDDTSTKNAGAQIQEEYKWNPGTHVYELSKVVKVNANRLATKELARIQDGTVETFADFLNGLWYKTTNTDSEIRYIYFDFTNKEIILVTKESQEVYEWNENKIRHNGMYITTVNSSITSLHRRFDISLVNVDEIRITIRDDIGIKIAETNIWDGQYKKLSLQSSFDNTPSETEKNEYLKQLEKSISWSTADSVYSITLHDSVYSFKANDTVETGVYSTMKIGAYTVIQFRSDSEGTQLNPTYALEFGTKTITEKIKKKTVEKIVTDYDSITFTPVKITPVDCFSTDGRSYVFLRDPDKKPEN